MNGRRAYTHARKRPEAAGDPDQVVIPRALECLYQRITHAAWATMYARGVSEIDSAYSRLHVALQEWRAETGEAPESAVPPELGLPGLAEPRTLRLRINCRAPSLNDLYSGQHWAERKRTADLWHALVVEAVGQAGAAGANVQRFARPVDIQVLARFRKSALDPDNVAGAAKLILDGLTHAGVLHDDTLREVRQVTLGAALVGEDAVEVVVREADDSNQ